LLLRWISIPIPIEAIPVHKKSHLKFDLTQKTPKSVLVYANSRKKPARTLPAFFLSRFSMFRSNTRKEFKDIARNSHRKAENVLMFCAFFGVRVFAAAPRNVAL
jgi:hypothetical protein